MITIKELNKKRIDIEQNFENKIIEIDSIYAINVHNDLIQNHKSMKIKNCGLFIQHYETLHSYAIRLDKFDLNNIGKSANTFFTIVSYDLYTCIYYLEIFLNDDDFIKKIIDSRIKDTSVKPCLCYNFIK